MIYEILWARALIIASDDLLFYTRWDRSRNRRGVKVFELLIIALVRHSSTRIFIYFGEIE